MNDGSKKTLSDHRVPSGQPAAGGEVAHRLQPLVGGTIREVDVVRSPHGFSTIRLLVRLRSGEEARADIFPATDRGLNVAEVKYRRPSDAPVCHVEKWCWKVVRGELYAICTAHHYYRSTNLPQEAPKPLLLAELVDRLKLRTI